VFPLLLILLQAAPTVPASPQPAGPLSSPLPASAAKCVVTELRQVGMVNLVSLDCPENKLSMELSLPQQSKAKWLVKDLRVNVVPTGSGQAVRYTGGRQPRSDYTRPQPLRVLITISGNKVTATVVEVTFH
jgi:hypothetical protein